MKRVGLIDNLSHIASFVEDGFERATAAQVMKATGGNTGNLAFVFGARRMLRNPVTRVGWNWTPGDVRARFDHLVICCANQIGQHADLGGWADRLEQFQLPVTLIGLGAQSDDLRTMPLVPAGTRRFLDYVKNAADAGQPNVAVRGAYTESVLEGFGVRAVRAGCPSLQIARDRDLGRRIVERQARQPPRKVAIAAGNPWHGPSAPLEGLLVDIVDRYGGDYVLQHPESMLQVAFGERTNITQATIDRFLHVYGGRFDYDGMLQWYRRNASVFVDVPNWMRFLSKFDAVVGPRYHGVALAIQANVPGCVVTIDSRTQELCDETAIKNLPVLATRDLSAEQLLEASMWSSGDAERFDANRLAKARQYVAFVDSNGLSPSDHLRSLADGY